MTNVLRERLIQIVVKAVVDGGHLARHTTNIVDALLASEEWRAREAVVEAAGNYANMWRLCHEREEELGPGPAQDLIDLGHVRGEMFAAVARLATVRGKEPDNATNRPA